MLVCCPISLLGICVVQAPNVAETEIGQGGTNAWSMGGVDPSTTVAVYFEVTNNANNPLPPHKRRFIQVHAHMM